MDQIRIETPESVDLALEPAGLGSRFFAAFMDGLIQAVVIFLLAIATIPIFLTFADENNPNPAVFLTVMGILFLAIGLLFFLYKLLFEAFWNGQTPGKRIAGIRVVQANGLPVTFWQVVIRNLLRIVDNLPSYYLIGAICVLASAKKQRLGDMAAGTVVVRDRPALAPSLPTRLSHMPVTDLGRLREYVMRLSEQDLAAARGYWERRAGLDPQARTRLATEIANGLVRAMGWPDLLPPFVDDFIEEVLFVRAQ